MLKYLITILYLSFSSVGWLLLRGLLAGGNANNGSNAGLVYSNSNNSPANSNANVGSRLVSEIYFEATASPLGEKCTLIKNGVGRETEGSVALKTILEKQIYSR